MCRSPVLVSELQIVLFLCSRFILRSSQSNKPVSYTAEDLDEEWEEAESGKGRRKRVLSLTFC